MLLEAVPVANNFSSEIEADWWADVGQEDSVTASVHLDYISGVLLENFVPPPPRPLYLEDIVSDGITTCDLCVWAWKESNPLTINTVIDSTAELGWLLCLVIVSLVSALLGAIIMTAVSHCKRIKNCSAIESAPEENSMNPSVKCITTVNNPRTFPPRSQNLWSWCSNKERPTQSQLEVPTSPTENHYTHIDETHNNVTCESIYTELDSESPCYQNATCITHADVPGSSGSSYYSDLSVVGSSDRVYEVVGLSKLNDSARPLPSVINGVSDYI